MPLPADQDLISVQREEDLIRRLQEKDEATLSYLYKNYSQALYGVIYRILQQQESSEDALQETFVKIWKGAQKYDPSKGRLYTWMLNIARNQAIDKLRSRELGESKLTQDIDSSLVYINTQQQIHFTPEHVDIKELTEKLRPEQKELLDLVYFFGFTQAEAAARLKIPIGTVKSRIRSAISELRKYFGGA
jgi:RNA polymerase sigma-70 factor (ECF subfamily)